MLERVGRGLLHIFDSWMLVLDDLIEPRFILGAMAIGGFYWTLGRVIDRLSEPPASELFAILNLAMVPVAGVIGFFFGAKTVGGGGNGPTQ